MTASAPAARQKRRTLIVGAAVCVMALIAVGVAVLFNRDPAGGAQSAGQAVRMYLEALARGDAQGALAMAKQRPPDTALLTEDFLRRQLQAAPITDIQILSPEDSPQVRVRAKFGDEASEATLLVTPPQRGESWLIDHAAIELRADGGIAAPLLDSMTMLGTPFPRSGTAYAFPGALDLGSSNPYLSVKSLLAQPTLLNGLTGLAQINLMPQLTLTEAGRADVQDALTAALEQCAKSKQLEPPGCPQRVRADGLVDGTVSWTAVQSNGINVAEFGGPSLDPTTGTVRFVGMANFLGLTVKKATGGTFSMPKLVVPVMGTADLTQWPPKITMGIS